MKLMDFELCLKSFEASLPEGFYDNFEDDKDDGSGKEEFQNSRY